MSAPVKLSVIIVSYNVRFFLEQCLQSVYRAGNSIPMEVFVVDNNSADGSCMMVRESFPQVRLIENTDNTGFSKANNQAIKQAVGEYILILNPDTVVEEDTFRKALDFLDSHPEGGALGVKMIDGKGRFLPESKRALPTPWVSFCKIFGLSALFPKSRRFGQYHLGYLSNEEIHQIEILPGAFMLIRKAVLDKVGMFDESYFMYGEDIDLSYRIRLAGYVNYYFPETTIIHYKGESTKKGSFNYVMIFYQAMIIFASRYFTRSNARIFTAMIRLSVWFRAGISLIKRAFERFYLPVLDGALAFIGFLLINPIWEQFKFGSDGHHPPEFIRIFVPAYIVVWLTALFFSGAYDQPVRIGRLIKAMAYGTAIILIFYSLLPESWRFSRAMIVLGSTWTLLTALIVRFLLLAVRVPGFKIDLGKRKRIAIVGGEMEGQRVSDLLTQTGQQIQIAGFISPDDSTRGAGHFLGSVSQIEEIIRINRIDEIIFCSKDLSTNIIIRHMLNLASSQTEYKIAPESTESIIGSNSINRAGDLYVIPIRSVGDPHNKRIKRLFDLTTGLVLMVLSPILLFYFNKRAPRFLFNLLKVTTGFRTWISYHPDGIVQGYHLPRIKKGILTPEPVSSLPDPSTAGQLESNLKYARDFTIGREIRILVKGFSRLAG